MRLFKSFLLTSLVTGLFAAVPALAQAPPTIVGRLALVSGTVAFHMAGETTWSAATLNYPVATGVSLWTDRDARAEIRIGPDTIDMASDTELDINRLDRQVTRITVPSGRIDLHLRRLGADRSFAIAIPRGTITLLAPGIYDITAGSDSEPARVAVFAGHARFVGGGIDLGIDPGVVARLDGFSPVTAVFARAVPDSFVAWCRSRDIDETRLVSPHYVSTEMTGYAVLDRYGHWSEIPGYGAVWFPNTVTPGWVPYRDGYWAWIAPWGWTWIDNEPWGFAPSHYGRWAVIAGAWGWVPGRPVPQPIYAPAVVAFIEGFFRQNQPLIAWFSLAPGEVYWPSYTHDIAYIRALNAPAVRDADHIALAANGRPPRQVFETRYVNQRFAVLVPQRAFAGARSAKRAVLPIAPARLEQVPATFAPPHVHPVVAHVLSPPPFRHAALPIGREALHPSPLVKPPAHPTATLGPVGGAGHVLHRPAGAPHPARPEAVARPPAPVLAKPAPPFHPLPPNAAALPPKRPSAPHPMTEPHRRESGAARAGFGRGRAGPAFHAPPIAHPGLRGPGTRPNGAIGIPPPERREAPHAVRRYRPSRPIVRRTAPHSEAFRTIVEHRGPGFGHVSMPPSPPPMRPRPPRMRPFGSVALPQRPAPA
jgi:hypothetical protein